MTKEKRMRRKHNRKIKDGGRQRGGGMRRKKRD